MRIALIGDYNEDVTAHRAIPVALELERDAIAADLSWDWLNTDALDISQLQGFDGGWVVPASPYADMDAALSAIRYLRESNTPFLGTCGGYQHVLVEYARTVLGHPDAGITEVDPDCPMPLVSDLLCALVEVDDPVIPTPGGLIDTLCGPDPMHEMYHCSFGLNPDYAHIFDGTTFHVAARNPDGDVRAMQLKGHPFFLGTAFQPERSALKGIRHPIISAFAQAIAAQSHQGP